MRALVLFFLVAVATPAVAEDTPGTWRPENQRTADMASSLIDAGLMGANLWHGFRESKRAGWCEAGRLGATMGVTELTKRLVHRTRPDGSDEKSFFSGHTASAFVSSGWNLSIGVPAASLVGILRRASNRHYLSDIAVGGAVGIGMHFAICR